MEPEGTTADGRTLERMIIPRPANSCRIRLVLSRLMIMSQGLVGYER